MSEVIKLEYPLDKVKEVIQKWLYLEDDKITEVMLATHLANQFKTDPLWTVFIAPPSSTKTELLRAFDGHPSVYSLSTLTPSTLISGKNTKDGKDPSLLPRLSDKTLIIKDFTTILSMRYENQTEILSQLREVYDGYYKKGFGTGRCVEWSGHVGLMAACTSVYDKHYGVIGAMGDRFMLFRSPKNNNRKMGFKALKNVGHEEEMREEIKNAIHNFINQFKNIHGIETDASDEIKESIVSLACFCAIARTPVERDRKTGEIKYQPEPEGPGRLTKQFTQLGSALALVNGKTTIDEYVYETIKKIGQDQINKQRLKIIKQLWNDKALEMVGYWKTTSEVANAVRIPTSTTKNVLLDLMSVDVVNVDREDLGKEKSPYLWQINQEISELIGASELFD